MRQCIHNRTEHYKIQTMEVLIKMDKKEKTIEIKMEQELKEYLRKGTYDLETLKQEIYAHDSFGYQNEIFDNVKKVDSIEIEIRYHDEMTQHFIGGNVL